MTVRVANFQDIPAIVDFMRASHARSRDAEITTFDEIEAKQLLVRCMQRHGHQNYMGAMVLVSETDAGLQGFVIGIIDQVYPCLKEFKVTDLLFIMGPDAPKRDAMRMIDSLLKWAENNPKVIKVLLGATDDLADWLSVSRFYEHAGLTQCGGLFRIDFDRRMAEAS